VQREDIHPSHDVWADWDVPDSHSPALQCRFCGLITCSICPPGKGMDDAELAVTCPDAPPRWRDRVRRLPLEIIPEDIAKPSREGPWTAGPGQSFQVASAAISIQASVTQLDDAVQRSTQRMASLNAAWQLPSLTPLLPPGTLPGI
jgi:hypothetical protein